MSLNPIYIPQKFKVVTFKLNGGKYILLKVIIYAVVKYFEYQEQYTSRHNKNEGIKEKHLGWISFHASEVKILS